MKKSTQSKIANVEATLSRIAGCPIELTVRGGEGNTHEFTLSCEGNKEKELRRAENFFGKLASCEFIYDEECDLSCLYITVRG